MIHLFPDHVALLVVDLLKDFCEGGALAVFGGNHIAPKINEWQQLYEHVLTTREEHPENHSHFSDEPKYEDGSWPSHCVQGTPGCKYNDTFTPVERSVEFLKGLNPHSHPYSAFAGSTVQGTMLDIYCYDMGITHLHICGLATNYCVMASVMEALDLDFTASLLLEGCRGIHPFLMEDQSSIFKMAASGALVASSPSALVRMYE